MFRKYLIWTLNDNSNTDTVHSNACLLSPTVQSHPPLSAVKQVWPAQAISEQEEGRKEGEREGISVGRVA